MNTLRVCKQCATVLPVGAPESLCPKCLMKIGLGSEAGQPKDQTAATPDLAELKILFPQLEIIELLGRGGMGIVYKARQRQLDRLVALKILPTEIGDDPAFAERFSREARALARLNHPNIVSIYDSGDSGGLFYFLMEYVDGVNLRQMLSAGRMEPKDALAIVPKICEALQYAHDEGIMHRDIKPENILFDKKGRVKIADFGLAKLLKPDDEDLTLTASGTLMGTPKYMSPEQLENSHTVDHRADIYSLGVVFYEMLTGELPLGRFEAPSKHVHIDVRLDEVVLRTLEKAPGRRYQHASELKTGVEEITRLDQLPPEVRAMLGFEHKSKRMVFGMPLVHVVSGLDTKTGKMRESRGFIACGGNARGFIALGRRAHGVFAFGAVASGVFAFGGVSMGIITMGGVGLGLFGFGGVMLSLILGCGGVAAAPIAFGGVAAGYFANGALTWGAFTMGRNSHDQTAAAFFGEWEAYFGVIGIIGTMLSLTLPSLIVIVRVAIAKRLGIAKID